MTQANLSDLAYRAAQHFGDRIALTVVGGDSLSFRDIDQRAGRIAGGLARRGIGAGDRVVLHLPNGWEWVAAYHAIARLGGVVVPANILLTTDEVAYITEDSQAAAVIVPGELATTLAAGPRLFVLGPSEQGEPFAALLAGDYHEPVARSPEDLFTIGYTSGTTGRPKGATMTHAGHYASLAGTATIHVRSAQDVILTSLPFPHVYGNIVMNSAFLTGARLVTLPRFDAGETLRLIGAEGVTLFEGVPTMYYQMLAHPGIEAADLSSLTRCTVGGQTMPLAKIDAVIARFGVPLCELWGMTELAGPAVTHSPYWPSRPGSIGMAMPGLEVRLGDLEDTGKTAALGQPGELMVRGTMVTQGYWRNEKATNDTIDPDGWLATGDIARADPDGYLYIVDRRKDMIITAGYNVYPAELEQVVAMHPAVVMVAVAGIADEEKGEVARAFIVRRPEASVTEDEILAHCRTHLAAYKVPRQVIFVDDLPRNSTGKILRRYLNDLTA